MTTVAAGWALISKRPDTYDDYSVLSACRTPFTPRQFNQIVAQNSPGNPPASHETGAAAMPWVWFAWSKRGDTTYVGIAIRDWTADFDATNRPIAQTRYFCVALDDFLAAGLTYTGLYEAVRDIPLDDRPTDDVVELAVPATPAVGAPVDLDLAATAAAGLLNGSVALLGGSADLADRLAVLDAVAGLLPAGAKAWLTVACWADFGVSHPLRLAFTARARDADLPVDLRAPNGPAGGDTRYRQRLLDLVRLRGADAVRKHLAGLTELRVCSPAEALAGLEELDLPQLCVQAARNGQLTPDRVRRLDASGRFGDLTSDQRYLVVQAYLDVATPADLWADRALLRRHRPPDAGDLVGGMVRTRSPRSSWTADELLMLAGVADALDEQAGFAGALPVLDAAPPGSSRLDVVVLRLAEHPRWSEALAPVVGQSATLSVAVLRRLHGGEHVVDPALVDLLDRDHGDGRWGRYRRLFQVGGETDVSDLDELNRIDGDAVPAVLRAAQRDADQGRLNRLFHAFLGLAGAVTHAIRPSWLALMQEWSDPDPAVRASLDFTLCRAGEPPRQDLATADEPYRNALVAEVSAVVLTPQQQQVFGDALAAGLRPGWGNSYYGLRDTLDLLNRLADPHTRPRVVTQRLVGRIADEVATNTDYLTDPALRRWLPNLEVDQRLHAPVLKARLRLIPEDAPAHEVAALVARVYAARALRTPEMVQIVMRVWEPTSSDWTDFLVELSRLLHDRGDRDARLRCQRWAKYLMEDENGRRLSPAAVVAVKRRTLHQAQLVVDLIRLYTQVPSTKDSAERALRDLGDRLFELLKKAGVDGRRGILGKRSGRSKQDEHD